MLMPFDSIVHSMPRKNFHRRCTKPKCIYKVKKSDSYNNDRLKDKKKQKHQRKRFKLEFKKRKKTTHQWNNPHVECYLVIFLIVTPHTVPFKNHLTTKLCGFQRIQNILIKHRPLTNGDNFHLARFGNATTHTCTYNKDNNRRLQIQWTLILMDYSRYIER